MTCALRRQLLPAHRCGMGSIIAFPMDEARARCAEKPEGTIIVLPVVRIERAPDFPPSKPRRGRKSLLRDEGAA